MKLIKYQPFLMNIIFARISMNVHHEWKLVWQHHYRNVTQKSLWIGFGSSWLLFFAAGQFNFYFSLWVTLTCRDLSIIGPDWLLVFSGNRVLVRLTDWHLFFLQRIEFTFTFYLQITPLVWNKLAYKFSGLSWFRIVRTVQVDHILQKKANIYEDKSFS